MSSALPNSSKAPRSPVVESTQPRLLQVLGPGLITGASDDDPSGIASYSQARAQFAFGLTWTMLFTYPLMSAVQMVAARLGRTTGRGIAGLLRRHAPNWLLQCVVILLLVANTINLGAMAEATRLLVGGPHALWLVLFGVMCKSLQLFFQYTRYVAVLRWLTLVLASRPRIMGAFAVGPVLKVLGWTATIAMGAAAAAMIATTFA